MINEVQVQAQINALVEQRNAAMNQAVNQAGEIALLKGAIAELQVTVTTLQDALSRREKELEVATALKGAETVATPVDRPLGPYAPDAPHDGVLC